MRYILYFVSSCWREAVDHRRTPCTRLLFTKSNHPRQVIRSQSPRSRLVGVVGRSKIVISLDHIFSLDADWLPSTKIRPPGSESPYSCDSDIALTFIGRWYGNDGPVKGCHSRIHPSDPTTRLAIRQQHRWRVGSTTHVPQRDRGTSESFERGLYQMVRSR